MTSPTVRAVCRVLLLSATLSACGPKARPPPTEEGPVARIWRQSAQAHDFEAFSRQGTRLNPAGELELEPTLAPAEGGHQVGHASAETLGFASGFDNVVPSFDVLTPPGTWVRLTLAAHVEGGWTKDYDFGEWALDEGTVVRHSAGRQEDTHGKVLTDTLVLGQKADGVRLTVWLHSTRPGVSPRVRALSAAATDTQRPARVEPSDGRAWGTRLPVPGRSQMLYPPKGGVWCSPTSVSMLLAYWSQRLGRESLVVSVPEAAARVYDATYQGTGNWPFNTAYATALSDGALNGLVARFDSLTQVERLIAQGIPISISVAYGPGELTGSPVPSSDGHLLVVTGFTPQGDVLCNDPAFPSDAAVSVTYRREELLRAWEHSRRAAYVLWPADTELPPGAFTFVP